MRKLTLLAPAMLLMLNPQAFSKNPELNQLENHHNISMDQNHQVPGMEVLNAWARPQNEGRNTAIYLELVNPLVHPEDLISAHCDNCERIEFHDHINDSGVMRMQKVSYIQVPQKGNTILKPGGMHIMCMGLSRSIQDGDMMKVSMQFKDAQPITIDVPVKNN